MMKMLCFTVMVILALTLVAEAQFSITIDAQKDAWYEGLTNPADGLVYLPARSYLRDINTTGGPDDDADLSAMVWMAWDDTYFYLYEEVKDDSIAVNNSTRYQNDCNEMKFDPDPSVGGATISSPNSRLTAYDSDLAQTPAGVDNLNDDGGLVDASGTAWVATTDDYARAVTDDGYILEFRIPWEFINHNASDRHMTVSVGEKFGMAMNLIDNDGIQRDNMLQWSAGHADAAWSNPSLHGTVTYLAGNVLGFEAVSAQDPAIFNDSSLVWYYPPVVAIEPVKIGNAPETFSLLQNYPNPFNPLTTIEYNLNRKETVTLSIYNVTGQLVRNLLSNRSHLPGSYRVVWDGTNDMGQRVASGIYFYQIRTSSTAMTNKMLLAR